MPTDYAFKHALVQDALYGSRSRRSARRYIRKRPRRSKRAMATRPPRWPTCWRITTRAPAARTNGRGLGGETDRSRQARGLSAGSVARLGVLGLGRRVRAKPREAPSQRARVKCLAWEVREADGRQRARRGTGRRGPGRCGVEHPRSGSAARSLDAAIWYSSRPSRIPCGIAMVETGDYAGGVADLENTWLWGISRSARSIYNWRWSIDCRRRGSCARTRASSCVRCPGPSAARANNSRQRRSSRRRLTRPACWRRR